MRLKVGLLASPAEGSPWRKRLEFSNSSTLLTLIVLAALNLWMSLSPVRPPGRDATQHSPGFYRPIQAPHSPRQQAETLLLNLQNPNGTWRMFFPENRHDPLLGYDYGLAQKGGWVRNKTKVWECIKGLGPHRRITFIGDSISRNFYARLVSDLGGPECSWFKKPKSDMAEWWWRAKEDFELDPGDIAPSSDSPPPPNVTLSFRFACNSFPHIPAIMSDPSVRDSDVFVINSGLWEMGTGVGTHDGSWMRDHMYRLSQLVLFLKQHVKARIIWRTIGAIEWSKGKDVNRFLPFKFRAMNLFAEGLFRGAGYEVVDFWSAMAIDTMGLTTHDGLHGGEALLADLVFNKVCTQEPIIDEEVAAEIVKVVDSSSMPPPHLQGPDPPFVPFP